MNSADGALLQRVVLNLVRVLIMHPETLRGQPVRRVVAKSILLGESAGRRLLRGAVALDPSGPIQLVDALLDVPPLVKVMRVLLEFMARSQCA